jgi:hypothetical protein
LSVCISGNATAIKWLLARFAADHGKKDQRVWVSSQRYFAEDQGAFLISRTSRATDWSSSYFLDRSFRRKGELGTGGVDGGRELNYMLGPDRSLGAKNRVVAVRAAAYYWQQIRQEATRAWIELRMGVCDMGWVPGPSSHWTRGRSADHDRW